MGGPGGSLFPSLRSHRMSLTVLGSLGCCLAASSATKHAGHVVVGALYPLSIIGSDGAALVNTLTVSGS